MNGRGLFEDHATKERGEGVVMDVHGTNLDVGTSVHTWSKTKKGKMVPTHDVEEIMEMHDRLTSKDLDAAKMLKELL